MIVKLQFDFLSAILDDPRWTGNDIQTDNYRTSRVNQ